MISRYVVTAFARGRGTGGTVTDSRGFKWNDDGSVSESFEVIAESLAEAIEQVQAAMGIAPIFRVTVEVQREVLIPPRLLGMIAALEDKTKENKP